MSIPAAGGPGSTGRDGWSLLTAGLVASTLAVVLLTVCDYGVTYDEAWHATYGDFLVRWYTTAFRDDRALSYLNLYNYGGAYDLPAQLLVRVSPLGLFETRHLLVALIGLAGVVGAHRVASRIGGSRAGFFAALFLLVTPRFYGDMFQNSKDVPFAVAFLWVLDLTLRTIPELPAIRWRRRLQLGAATGVLLGVRIGGVLVVVPWLVVLCLWWAVRMRASPQPRGPALRSLLVGSGWVCAIAYAVMLSAWPAAQVHPVLAPARALGFAANFQEAFDVLFDGRWIKNTELPASYLIRWFEITLPEFYFVAFAGGLVTIAGCARRSRPEWVARDLDRVLSLTLLATASAFPFVYYALATPTTYDGVRHFLFTIPPLASLAGVSLGSFLAWQRRPWIRAATVAAVGALVLFTVSDLWRLHPYEYVYFNRVSIGGLPGAASRFDTDYWGASYKEGVAWLVDHAPDLPGGRKLEVASCLHSVSTSYYLPSARFEYVGSYDDGQPISYEPDVLLATTRWGCNLRRRGRILHVVERMGVPLLYVLEVDHADGHALPARRPPRADAATPPAVDPGR